MERRTVTKTTYIEEDFEEMNWHDCKIYAIYFNDANYELVLDIDYIIKWIYPEEEKGYQFWVSPATLIFTDVFDVNVTTYSLNLEIQEIRRILFNDSKNFNNIKPQYSWIIETNDGEITFKSTGFTQYLRKAVFIEQKQKIDLFDRGGISFDTLYQD